MLARGGNGGWEPITKLMSGFGWFHVDQFMICAIQIVILLGPCEISL